MLTLTNRRVSYRKFMPPENWAHSTPNSIRSVTKSSMQRRGITHMQNAPLVLITVYGST